MTEASKPQGKEEFDPVKYLGPSISQASMLSMTIRATGMQDELSNIMISLDLIVFTFSAMHGIADLEAQKMAAKNVKSFVDQVTKSFTKAIRQEEGDADNPDN